MAPPSASGGVEERISKYFRFDAQIQNDPFSNDVREFNSLQFLIEQPAITPFILDPIEGRDEYKECSLGPEGFPPPVHSAVVIREGKLYFGPAAELSELSSSFLIEFYDDDVVTTGMVNSFNALIEEFPDEREKLTQLFIKLHEDVSSLEINGGNVEDLQSFNELYEFGIKLRKRIEADEEDLARLKSKEESLETSQISLAIASGSASMKGGGRGSAYFDKKLVAASSEKIAMGPKISAQESKIDEKKKVRTQLLDLFSDLLNKLHSARTPEDKAIARGTAAAVSEGLGDRARARIQYDVAAQSVSLNPNDDQNNPLMASYFELQSIRLMPEDDGDEAWEAKVTALNGYMAKVRSQVSQVSSELDMRDGPSLHYQAAARAEGALRAMKAEALMLKVGLYAKNDMESDDDEYEALMSSVLSQMRKATDRPASRREAKFLALSLATLEEVRVNEAAKESRVGDLDMIEDLAPLMDQDVYVAEKMYEAHGFKDEGLASVLNTAYYSLYHQSGLPVDAVYTWFHKAYSEHKDCELVAKQADLIKQKAPHFFEGAFLKPRSEIKPPENGAEAKELEANLHITNGSMLENFAIGTPTWIAGTWAGAKTGASAGIFCGPFAEACVPAGGIIGGIGGFFASEKIVGWLHADEVENMENQAELAGVDLLRVTKEESELTAGLQYAGLGLGAVMSGGFGGWASKGATPWGIKGAADFLSREGTRGAVKWIGERAAYAASEVVYEVKHTGNYFKGIGWALKGLVGKGGDKVPKAIGPDEAFELIYARMSPGQLRKLPNASKMSDAELKQAWRQVFDNLADYGDTVLFRGGKPLEYHHYVDLDDAFNMFYKGNASYKGLKPKIAEKMSEDAWREVFNNALTKPGEKVVGGRIESIAEPWINGRVDAMKHAVSANVPELVESRIALMGRKELLRQAFRESQGFDLAMAQEMGTEALAKEAAKKSPEAKGALGKAWSAAFSPKTQRLYRLGMLAAAADYAFVEDTPEGYALTWWDGKIDTGWGVAGYIAGTGYYSTKIGINTYNGGILGGGTKAITFVGFQGLSGLAVMDSDIMKIRGAQDEYLLVLPATLLLYSGMHAKGGKSAILNAVSQAPFGLRRLPSLTAYTSAYGAHSLISKPNFIRTIPGAIPNNAKGMAVSLGHTIPFIMAVTAVTGKELLSSDPYFVGQRGVKFAAVGVILNPIQIALGGDTGLAQGAARGIGILFDMVPAISMSPYYNNRKNLNRTLVRMAGEKGPDDVNEELNLFMSDPDNWMTSTGMGGLSTINRTFDIGGWMGRDSFDITDPGSYNLGWRWEPDGVDAWLDAMEGWDDHKRGKWIEGAAEKHPEIYTEMAGSLKWMSENPDYWFGSEHRTRGMVIASIMAKWYAERYKNGEKQFEPYAKLIDSAPKIWRDRFWSKLPQVYTREELLNQVTVVQDKPFEEVVKTMLATSYIDVTSADK